MKLKHYFILLAVGIVLIAGVALFGTFRSNPVLFYVTEGFAVLLLAYLWYFYRKTIRPYDTLIGGMELVKDLDLTTRLAPSGQHETDIIVRTFNDLLGRLRSEHLRLEEQYTFLNLLIEASPMGVILCDLDGNMTSMNPAAREMLSSSIETAIHTLALGETTTVRIPGEPQLFRISHLSFPDRGFQHPFYLIESLTSEVRLAEKAAYERVIRMIAHEVNNSVAGIIGSLSGEEAERLTALSAFVTRFAEVVKIPQPQLQLCDLSEEVEACRPFLENLCTQAHVHIDFHLTDEAVPVRLDTVLFQQVLINIVKNAVESIGDAQGLITVTTSPSQLVIADNGHGIPSEIAQNLFTPFFSTKPQGQGLGLLLIRDILTSHHCTFSLITDPEDRLTRFTIQFPTKE
ncbi:MAG: PAS domain-containing protein [Bacteroidaceae bacterium]|nr:PAS domain-containing protein [Bacteroidaceae bacterium]